MTTFFGYKNKVIVYKVFWYCSLVFYNRIKLGLRFVFNVISYNIFSYTFKRGVCVMKKFISLILCLVFVFSFGVTAFAVDVKTVRERKC